MRWSAKQLRWLALGGALSLAAILAGVLGLARYRAGVVWQRILKRNGVNLVQESNGITWSQSVKGRTVFTLHAEKSTPRGKGVYSLHNAVLILYGKDGRDDRIHGNEFEYDQGEGILRAIGEVRMDLQAPEPAGGAGGRGPVTNFSFAPDDGAAAGPEVIHVRTSGLVFRRKGEIAETREPVEFSYRGMRCESMGAEFDAGQSALHLLAEVKMAGTIGGAPFLLRAARADMDRGTNLVTLGSPDWASGDRAARADHLLLHLRKGGSLEKGDGAGHVVVREGSRTLSAPQSHAVFGDDNKPRQAMFTGGVQFTDEAPGAPAQGSSSELTLTTDAQGVLNNATAEGNVQWHMVLGRPEQGKPRQGAGVHHSGTRDLKAGHATASFEATAGGKQLLLRTLDLRGGAQLAVVSAGDATAGETRTAVRADVLTTDFLPGLQGEPAPQRLIGLGHTTLEQVAADGQRQVSEGDRLDVQFAQRAPSIRRTRAGAGAGAAGLAEASPGAAAMEVSTAVQTGHVVLHAWPAVHSVQSTQSTSSDVAARRGATAAQPSVGRAERALYESGAGTLTLTSSGEARAEVDNGSTQFSAAEIVLHEATGNAEGSGGIALTTVGQPGTAATHVLAARARLLHEVDQAEFYGSDRQPAQLWQGTSQVSAASLALDGKRHTLSARPELAGGLVHAVFASEHRGADGGASPAGEGSKAAGKAPVAASAIGEGALFGGAGPARGLAREKETEASRDALRVAAEALDYSDGDREATFRGNVAVRGSEGVLNADRGAVFLQNPASGNGGPGAGLAAGLAAGGMSAASGMGGRVQRFVLLGDVRLAQPGRTAQGAQLTYTAATDRFVLTGTPAVPPRVTDAGQGAVTGETLVFGAANKSVVVSGSPATDRSEADRLGPDRRGAARRRVHTETDIKR